MTLRRTPTRLELHRLKYHWTGKKSALLTYVQLDPEEQRQISEAVFNSVYLDKSDPYAAYARVFSEWGVACPHPQHKRYYSGATSSIVALRDHRWYWCDCCGCSCMNEDFDPRMPLRKIAR